MRNKTDTYIMFFISITMIICLFLCSKSGTVKKVIQDIKMKDKLKVEEQYYKKCIKYFDFEKIPKVCYQTWESYELPNSLVKLREKNKKINPDIEFVLFNDVDREKFIKENFDSRTYNAYKKINLGVIRADFWRYCILYINGGIYLDIKSSINRKLFNDIIKEDDVCLLDIERKDAEEYRKYEILGGSKEQWLLIFSKDHPYLKYIIDILVNNILENNICISFYDDNIKEKILRLSGPDAFAAAIKLYITHNCMLHRTVNYDYFASISPIGRPMYNKNNKHYSLVDKKLILDDFESELVTDKIDWYMGENNIV